MNVDDALRGYPPVRRFDADFKMNAKAREKLLAAVLSSHVMPYLANWHFVLIDDPEQRQRIRAAAWDQPQVTEASMLIILCTDLEAWRKASLHCWHPVQQTFAEFYSPDQDVLAGTLNPVERDELMRSCGIVVQTLMITARSMGYDSSPLDGFDADEVGELINLPADHAVCMLVAIGKGMTETHPDQMELPMERLISTDSFATRGD